MTNIRFVDCNNNPLVSASVNFDSINPPVGSGSYLAMADNVILHTDSNGYISGSLVSTTYKIVVNIPPLQTVIYGYVSPNGTFSAISSSASSGSVNTVTFDLMDYLRNAFAAKSVTVEPLSPSIFSGSVVCMAVSKSITDTNGESIFSTLVPNKVFLCHAYGDKETTKFYINTQASGSHNAVDLIVAQQAKTIPQSLPNENRTYVLSVSASDARYGQGGGTSLTSGSSYNITSSWSSNALTASFYGGTVTSSSYASTSSWALNALTSSFVTASNVVGVITSSSYARTASFIPVGTYSITSSWSNNSSTASFITASNIFGTITNSKTASYVNPLSQSFSLFNSQSNGTAVDTFTIRGPSHGGTSNGIIVCKDTTGQILSKFDAGYIDTPNLYGTITTCGVLGTGGTSTYNLGEFDFNYRGAGGDERRAMIYCKNAEKAGGAADTTDLILVCFNGSNVGAGIYLKGETGYVGINSTTPTYQLQVDGTFRVSDVSIFDSSVGVGTESPSEFFDVHGTCRFSNVDDNCYVETTNNEDVNPKIGLIKDNTYKGYYSYTDSPQKISFAGSAITGGMYFYLDGTSNSGIGIGKEGVSDVITSQQIQIPYNSGAWGEVNISGSLSAANIFSQGELECINGLTVGDSIHADGNIEADGTISAPTYTNNGVKIPEMRAGAISVAAATSANIPFVTAMPSALYSVSLIGSGSALVTPTISNLTTSGFTASFAVVTSKIYWSVIEHIN